jgi:hypothetical protein
MAEELDTHNRALKINLDPGLFGTFAEIGAGQEVARWFLQVGGAAGTVAKTMSAYDMKFSDDIYGKGTRYVSRERLLAMLDHEYRLLLERLDEKRGADTQFFVFADTVSARNYAGTNECHGWMGMRFQHAPRSEPSEVLLHLNLRDPTNLQQQQALGILGVDLIHATSYARGSVESFLDELFAGLTLDRMEIDVVEVRGPAFDGLDGKLLGIELVQKGLALAVLFDGGANLIEPSSGLRKRPIVIERGMFTEVTGVHRHMLEDASRAMREEVQSDREPLSIPELTVIPVKGLEVPDEDETYRRLSHMIELGGPVLLTRFPEVYHLTSYLRRYTQEALRFVFGAPTLVQIFHAAHYQDLIGGVLEALGRLLGDNVKLYIYPTEVEIFKQRLEERGIAGSLVEIPSGRCATAETLRFQPPVDHLYRYLLEANWIVGLEGPG